VKIKMSFTQNIISQVWAKGQIVNSNPPIEWRKDQCDAWIGWRFYGNRNSPYGWEIDHITPVDNGGSDDLSNLRPLQWENNAERQTDGLTCSITAQGVNNVRK